MDLFDIRSHGETDLSAPLAERMRPLSLEKIIGQDHLTGKGSLLETAIAHDRVFSMILWGPPGCGKTTLARIIEKQTRHCFVAISAVLCGVKDVRKVIDTAKEQRRLYKKRTLLFVDEIHRFNKAQQDAFLHHVENGLITLIGATTQNPSFEIIPALVSRCRVFVLKKLETDHIIKILKRAVSDPDQGLGNPCNVFAPEAYRFLADSSQGDARIALANLETIIHHYGGNKEIQVNDIETAIAKKSMMYDKAGEEHFNLISAFIKSMRGSDPDAAVYWLSRMLLSGEDPYYMIRRMIRFATEDIGLADPGALTMALNAKQAFHILGHPEGEDALIQAAIYLATAPKSNSVYKTYKNIKRTIDKTGYQSVPMHIRNAPTKMMEQMDYGKGYKYPHDYEGGIVKQSYLPDKLAGQTFYYPTDSGYENTVKARLKVWKKKLKNG